MEYMSETGAGLIILNGFHPARRMRSEYGGVAASRRVVGREATRIRMKWSSVNLTDIARKLHYVRLITIFPSMYISRQVCR